MKNFRIQSHIDQKDKEWFQPQVYESGFWSNCKWSALYADYLPTVGVHGKVHIMGKDGGAYYEKESDALKVIELYKSQLSKTDFEKNIKYKYKYID
tara:strand:- start:3357 stop:3644 length:288 start_codon:yes stop_codon:yes gene_type:complete